MSIEIERKFLVKSVAFKNFAFKKLVFKQGYLNSDKQRNVRVRVADSVGFLTIKGISNSSGTSRYEWEKKITKEEANELLQLSEPLVIKKTRYFINEGKHVYEVDEFHDENEGLLLAEIELQQENESFSKPFWLGEEVTGNPKYYNSYLSKNPFTGW